MKITRVKYDGIVWAGSVDEANQKVRLIARDTGLTDPVIDLIHTLNQREVIDYSAIEASFDDIEFLPPIRQPSKNIICVGKNYTEHAIEFAGSGYDSSMSNKDDIVPDAPIIFSKAACTMIGAHSDIIVPWDLTSELDYEAELGVIIGKGGRSINAADAYDHIFGYTVINDVTARDLQAQHKQWHLGKSIDTFCPIGPWIVTTDEVTPENLDVTCLVNGELRQSGNTRDFIFDIPSLIETTSASMTLSPGDIIATGTPAGVGIGFKPPKFLESGDVVKISISNVGTIENTVV